MTTFIGAHCEDCGVGTFTAGEYYMVRDELWEQAWAGRRKPWHSLGREILCIGCLEKRIGRTLKRSDFPDFPVNDPEQDDISDRLRARLTADSGGLEGQ